MDRKGLINIVRPVLSQNMIGNRVVVSQETLLLSIVDSIVAGLKAEDAARLAEALIAADQALTFGLPNDDDLRPNIAD